ncbi:MULTISPECIES: flagellar protein FlgN [unclassified Paenibacillus]|uniref:flagellar protein FlgN n=1 Tax=unclassified Paenibacillus TaxID=185978 RepID=UPI001AE650DB|nr:MULTISPECIES: flagellar protein FlgN [unclassified Paenibacillus]MBP1157807.1 flagellar biosynthesis/type III secretory pathway chaperone [Paenibacillus sp. PvP091]MBP1171457.1 flagellar biosynthesis/type III secretory pathway chaperone [Paenibacillus sp. PvR098]MBP2442485.1 flagellar biosynthesis/type III secretory pathway chaperone [Paenibacillus sp. PvP052]
MSLEALLQTMAELNDVHNTLLDLAERKKHVLIHNEVEQLTQIVNKENKLLKRIGELDQQRVEATGAFLMEKGYKPNPRVTVSDLTKIIFNIDEKKMLMDEQKRLMAMIRKLRERNQLNQQLLEHSLAFVNYSLDLIVGAPEDDVVYTNPQQQTYGTKRQGLFDTRA